MTECKVIRIETPSPQLVDEIALLEEANFGRGGLNEWHLPFIIRHGRLYALESSGKILGAASLIRDWDHDAKAYLVDFAIVKGRQKEGLGRLLLKGILEEMEQEGTEVLELTVAEENSSATNLYERFGFCRVDFLKDEYGQGQDRWLLRLITQVMSS